jgi:hypothetical protein
MLTADGRRLSWQAFGPCESLARRHQLAAVSFERAAVSRWPMADGRQVTDILTA